MSAVPTIELENVYRFYGSTRAVDGISFSVPAGQVCGFIGPNGAGKTTSMRILATLDLPTSGEARVDGFSVIDDPDRVRRRLGYMPDDFGTYPNVTCYEYLDFFARAYGLRGTERRHALSRVVSFTGLEPLLQKPVNGLSKGMRQRLCLGRTLIHDPSVLILDEPAAGLDPRARVELRDMICGLTAEGKTLLVSSHILTELAEMCDLVAIIEQGKLLAVGRVDEILMHRTARRQVKVTVLEGAESLAGWLAEREGLEQIRRVESSLTFSHELGREADAALLAAMIGAGFRVVEYAGHRTTLEEAFMEITRGRVQ